MLNKKRLFALLMCLALVLTLFVSSTYIVSNASHSCHDYDCDICVHIAQAMVMLHSMALLAMFTVLSFLANTLCHRSFASENAALSVPETPVDWKVRLND